MAALLNRNPSTISKELERNQGSQRYCPEQAQYKVLDIHITRENCL
ncbi:hypothetical protein [Xenorhabdus budapestensis]